MPGDAHHQLANRESDASLTEHTALESFEEGCVRLDAIVVVLSAALQSAGGMAGDQQQAIPEILDWPEPSRLERVSIVAIDGFTVTDDCIYFSLVPSSFLDPYSDPDVEYPPDILFGKK